MPSYDSTESDIEQKLLFTILARIKEGLIIVDTNRKAIHINTSAEEITGYKNSEVQDEVIDSFLKLIDTTEELDIETYIPAPEISFEGVAYAKEKLILVKKDGTNTLVNVETRKLKGADAIGISCIIFLEDVTKASEFERMKTDFIALAEHYLRTPISIIMGSISTLLAPTTVAKLDQSEIDMLNGAMTGASDLRGLIENLLYLGEIQQDKVNPKYTKVNIVNLTRQVVKDLGTLAESKGLTVSYIPPIEEVPLLYIDPVLIKEVLKNFITNAITYTEHGYIQVNTVFDTKNVQISVRDSGKGIPTNLLSNLFNKFYRIKKPLEMSSGYGIDLYICKKIIEKHKGQIWAESVEGTGSTFYFTLPIVA